LKVLYSTRSRLKIGTIIAAVDKLLLRYLHAAFWSFLGAGLTGASRFAVGLLVARRLGTENFGLFAYSQATVGALLLVAGMGMATTSSRQIAASSEHEPNRLCGIISLCYGLACVGGLLSCVLVLTTEALIAPLGRNMSGVMFGVAVLLWSSTVDATQVGILSGFEAFRSISIAQTAQSVAAVVISTIVIPRWGVAGALCGLAVAVALGCLVNHFNLRKILSNRSIVLSYNSAKKEKGLLIDYAVPSLLAGLPNAPSYWIATSILTHSVDGYPKLAAFSSAYNWRSIITLLANVSARFNLPILSSLYSRDAVSHRRAVKSGVFAITGVALFIGSIFIAFPEAIMSTYGRGYYVPGVLEAVVFSAVISCTNGALSAALASAGWMWSSAFANSAWGMVLVLSTILLAPNYGALGLAYGLLLAEFMLLISYGFIWFRGRRTEK